MKSLLVKDSNGQTDNGWMFGTYKATQVGVGKPRLSVGWALQSPDGCLRHCEGNYQQFVPFANTVLENYGVQTRIS